MNPEPGGVPPVDANALLEAAWWYARRGWAVFPLVPGEKRPAVRNWERVASTDPDVIRSWWGMDAFGIGIATGPSGLVVIDLDVPKPGTQPGGGGGPVDGQDTLARLALRAGETMPWNTYVVGTPSGGTHLYFRAPEGHRLRNTTRTLGPYLDTRAGGGYVVAAPTALHAAHTSPYRVLNTTGPIVLPDWLHTALVPPPRTDPGAPGHVQGPRPRTGPGRRGIAGGGGQGMHPYLAAVITDQTDRIRTATSGTRNRTLYLSALILGSFVGGGELPTETAEQLLTHAATTHVGIGGFTTTEATATIRSGLAAGALRPRTIPTRGRGEAA